MALIKDIYSKEFYQKLANSLSKVLAGFNEHEFMSAILPPEFVTMEWKQRMQHTTQVLHLFMPTNYAEAASLFHKLLQQLRNDGFGEQRLEFMFLPEYVAMYGLEDFDHSVEALALFTQFISAEFAVRPFLLKYKSQMLVQMLKFSTHENHHVRRFASEGSRPRLPWGAAIPWLKANPTELLPLLENLKNDPSEYVRRSVANNLNDITKDHPEVVIAIAKKWKGLSKPTDAIIKHACRSLLKAGHPGILDFYGLTPDQLDIKDFIIESPNVKIGDALAFGFTITNQSQESRYIRLEYAVHYLKNNGNLAAKVFKISEKTYAAGESISIKRKQSFRLITTRKFYSGAHRLSILVNGSEKGIADFALI